MKISKTGSIEAINFSEVGPAKGLVSWYPPINDGDDYAGNNVATLSNVTTSSGNGRGLSFHIPAKNSYIGINPIGGSIISASLWYYYESSATWNTLLCRDGGASHHIVVRNDGFVGFHGGGAFHSSGVQLSVANWYHLAVVKDGVNSKLYINGALEQNSNSSFDNNAWPLAVIGNFGKSSPIQGALGRIYDVRIYNRILSAEEVGIIHDLTIPNGPVVKKTYDTIYIRGQLNEVSL